MLKQKYNSIILFGFPYFILDIQTTKIFIYRLGKNYLLVSISLRKLEIDKFNLTWPFYSFTLLTNYWFNSFLKLFCKLTFKGKSYRVKNPKKLSKLTFRLGYSHFTKIKFTHQDWKILKLSRQKFIIIGISSLQLKKLQDQILKIRTLNVYTSRGLRISQQLIIKRFGKLSQYISKLH